MSFILALDEAKLEQLIELLPRYEQKILDAEPVFKLEGRRLEEIIRSLPHYQANYDQSLQEIKAVDAWLETIKEKVTAKLWRKYLEGYSRALSTRDIQAYIAGEKEIVELNQISIEITLLKNKFEAIVEALKQMGWMMGHVTKLRVSEMQDAIF
jgi:hypothetical protein